MRKFLIKISALLCLCCFISSFLCGCTDTSSKKSDKIKILCAGFSQTEWVQNIIEGSDTAEVEPLYASGVDIHNFQASAADIVNISEANIFVFNGGVSDKPLYDVLDKSENANRIDFDCMKHLGNLVLSEDENVAVSDGEHKHEENDNESDEHIWLSLKNAIVLVDALAKEISSVDPQNSALYKENSKKYIEKLNELDREYENSIVASAKRILAFADRFPFRYLAADYSLECFAAFPGCSTETDASFASILFLADKVDEFDLNYVITVDRGQNSVSKSVIESAKKEDIKVVSVNSLQNVNDKDVKNGLTYLSAMESNLTAIRTALDQEV